MQFSVTTKVIRFPKKGCCPRLIEPVRGPGILPRS
jgi:hypothetical protein